MILPSPFLSCFWNRDFRADVSAGENAGISGLYIPILNYMSKKDLFGFVTQGLNYELFRPRYPAGLLG